MTSWNDWETDDKVRAIDALRRLGFSASQIGHVLGCSRNAVLGIAHRNSQANTPKRKPRRDWLAIAEGRAPWPGSGQAVAS